MIDFLITWVDGNDPEWIASRKHYAPAEIANESYRYREWGWLRYWFRGIERFAPWVNRVFFVTCGHYPEWLDKDNPKLRLVKHEYFIPQEYLPTFNSNVIEFWFHRIQGLSEQFVYFNDDTFLLGPVGPDRFFRHGLPCDIGGMTFNIHSGMFGSSVLLSRTLINDHFHEKEVIHGSPSKWFNIRYPFHSLVNFLCLLVSKNEFPGFVNPHLPQAYLKSIYDDIWAKCSDDLTRTSHNRFRQYGDIASWLIRYWQLASNWFSPVNVYRDGQYYLIDDSTIGDITHCIRHQKKKLVCLNDSNSIKDFRPLKEEILSAFESILPDKSSYELY